MYLITTIMKVIYNNIIPFPGFKLARLGNSNKAYRAISFEREAYGNEKNLTYTITRAKYAWRKLI